MRRRILLFATVICAIITLTYGEEVLTIADESTAPWVTQANVDQASVAKSKLVITQPPELAGTLMWAQSPTSGPMFTVSDAAAAAGTYDLSYDIILPHSQDDRYACDPFTHTTNDEGQSLAGSIVIGERSGCLFAPKLLNIQATGAAAIVIYSHPTASSDMVRIGVPDVITAPIMYFSRADGQLIRSWLQGKRDYLADLARWPTNTTMPAGKNYQMNLRGTVTGTGKINPSELTALKKIAATFQITEILVDQSALRDWKELLVDNPADPCLNRVVGIYCEKGSVISVYLKYFNLVGTFDSAWGSLPKLQYLTIDENTPASSGLVGPVPDSICQLTELLSIQIEANSLTSVPECMGTALTKLRVLLLERNQLTALPSVTSAWRNSLVWFTAFGNSLTSLPSDLNQWSQMGLIDIGTNNGLSVDVSILDFRSWYQLTTFRINECAFKGTFTPTAFNGLSLLQTVEFSHNQISGDFPTFAGCSVLASLDASVNQFSGALPNLLGVNSLTSVKLSNNSFTGGIPDAWKTSAGNIPAVTAIYADFNQLSGPMNNLAKMDQLQFASFQWNQITTLGTDPSGDVGYALFNMVGLSMNELHVDHNLLNGPWIGGVLADRPTILSMSYNGLTNIPSDLWTTKLLDIDFSYNELEGDVPSDINAYPGKPPIINFNIQGNKKLTVQTDFPEWLEFATPITYLPSADGLYECRLLISPNVRGAVLTFDPQFTNYQGCRCAKGRFGKKPPNCDIVPVAATVTPYGRKASSNETDLQHTDPNLFASILLQYDDQPNGVIGVPSNKTRQVVLPASFTDSWYGPDRLTIGLSTYWTIDLTAMRLSSNMDQVVESTNSPSVASYTISPDETLQPVRLITVRLHISPKYFTGIQNSLIVSEGTRDQPGKVMKQLLGADWISQSVPNMTFTRTPEYLSRYAAALANLEGEPSVIEVKVFSNAATIYFSSRDSSNTHFVATYSYDFECGSGLVVRQDSSALTDEEKLKYQCIIPIPPKEEYDLPVRIAVWIMVGVALSVIILNVVVLAWKWNAPIYRAASRLFVSMILFFLASMAAGAVQYAIEPDLSSSDPGICIGRAWLSALPLSGILAVLLVKTWRLYKIFCSTKIMKVTNASDSDLMRTIGIICALETILLIVWSVLKLSQPEETTLEHVQLSGYTFDRYRIIKCSQEDGFIPWIIVQLSVIFIGMVTVTFLSIKTRHIPTAFNESSHIMASCAILVFFFVMIVPLDFWLQDKPEVGVLLQGFGQAFLALSLTCMLMGPKLFIALTYSDADQTAMTKEITSGPNTNISSRGSMTNSSSNLSRSSVVSKPTPVGTSGSAGKLVNERGSVMPAVSNVPKFGTKSAPINTDKPRASVAPVRPSFVRPPSSSAPGATPKSSSMPAQPPSGQVSPLGGPAASPSLQPMTPLQGSNGTGQDVPPMAAPGSPSIGGRSLTGNTLTNGNTTAPPASPSAVAAPPTVAIHFRVAPNSPRGGANGSIPGSPAAGPSPSPVSPVGDSALDFVKRLRSRLPQSTGAAPNGASPPASPRAIELNGLHSTLNGAIVSAATNPSPIATPPGVTDEGVTSSSSAPSS